MSRIHDLIRELCPDGVAAVQLGEVCRVKTGQNINKTLINSNPGEFPVINSGKEPLGFFNSFNVIDDPIGIASRGSVGLVTWTPGRFFRGNLNYGCTVKDPKVLSARFLYHLLLESDSEIQALSTHQGIPALNASALKSLRIALPPIDVQREIVSILDKFTQLQAELEAELEARRVQYEETRNNLLNFDQDIPSHPLSDLIQELCPEGVPLWPVGEVADVQRGSSISKKETSEGNVPVLAGGQKPAYWHSAANRNGENVVVAGSGAYAGFVSYWTGPIWASDSFTVSGKDGQLLTKFCFYWLKNMQPQLHFLKRGSGVPHVYAKDVSRLDIPVPPLGIQREIVSILDKLDALVNDISYGLPAELEARRKQYEYYRNKLLTFNELDAA